MDTYQYKYGDRPLEGYTIQRAAGRGGFGEVYYALSDSGRQVALKAIQSYEQIELRGISQCMNLKSPHLVTIFDVRHNDQGKPFVIMEYVSGPSLADLLRESPGGLGTQKAAFFLREIAKGLSFLHEGGIVHRDLKPGNIFYENGYVKIGDYGLTKAISTSHHVSHTITVGTVHYMAPEIGAGRYDRSIDIYALGVLLYEMLTGQVPFLGASPAEILMKHMTALPDLGNIEEPFARVIRRALAKDPVERYQSVQEMVEDIFGAEHVRNSVSQFSPEELSVVAGHVAQKLVGGGTPRQAQPMPAQQEAESDFSKEIGKKAEFVAKKAETLGRQVAEKFKTVKERAHQVRQAPTPVADPLSPHQRKKLALIAMAATALGAGFLCGFNEEGKLKLALVVFVMIGLASQIILRSLEQWWAALDHEKKGLGRAGTVLLASFLAVMAGTVLSGAIGVAPSMGGSRPIVGFGPFGLTRFLALALPLLLVDWVGATDPQRGRRVTLGWPVLVGFLGLSAGGIFGLQPIVTACTLAGIVLVVQTQSPFGRAMANPPTAEGGPGAGAAQVRSVPVRAYPQTPADSDRYGRSAIGTVPGYVQSLWLIGWLVSLGVGLMLVIFAGTQLRGEAFAFAVAFGVDLLILSVFCFLMMFRRTFAGWYRYIIRPALLTLCVMTTVTASILMGNLNLRHEAAAMALFFIIFPNILFLVVLFVPARLFGVSDVGAASPPPPPFRMTPAGAVSSAKRLIALILAGVVFIVPLAGLHRFYVGKIGTGILWLFTGGLLGIGQLIDAILIIAGQFKDRNGFRVVVWTDASELDVATPQAAPQAAGTGPRQAAAAPVSPPPAVQRAQPEAMPAQPPSWPPYAGAPTTYESFDPIGGLLAAVGHIIALAAILIGLVIGLHLPAVANVAWAGTEPVQQFHEVLGPGWPGVMEQVGAMLIVVLLFTAAVLIMVGRRRSGPAHLVRAVLALVGFFLAISVVHGVMSPHHVQGVVELFSQNQAGPALERLFSTFSRREALIAGAIMLTSVFLMSWPPHRRTPVFAPMPAQGVVL